MHLVLGIEHFDIFSADFSATIFGEFLGSKLKDLKTILGGLNI